MRHTYMAYIIGTILFPNLTSSHVTALTFPWYALISDDAHFRLPSKKCSSYRKQKAMKGNFPYFFRNTQWIFNTNVIAWEERQQARQDDTFVVSAGGRLFAYFTSWRQCNIVSQDAAFVYMAVDVKHCFRFLCCYTNDDDVPVCSRDTIASRWGKFFQRHIITDSSSWYCLAWWRNFPHVGCSSSPILLFRWRE